MKIGWCKCLQEIVLIYYFVVPFLPMQMYNYVKFLLFYAHSGITTLSFSSV